MPSLQLLCDLEQAAAWSLAGRARGGASGLSPAGWLRLGVLLHCDVSCSPLFTSLYFNPLALVIFLTGPFLLAILMAHPTVISQLQGGGDSWLLCLETGPGTLYLLKARLGT